MRAPVPYNGNIELLSDRYEVLQQRYAELAEEEEEGVAS